MNCPECGVEIKGGSSLCHNCGSPVNSHAQSHFDVGKPDQFESLPREYIPERNYCHLVRQSKKGSFFRRALTLYFDLIVQGSIVLVFFAGGIKAINKGLLLKGSAMGIEDILIITGPLMVAALMINLAYFTFFHWARGQTPGKILNNLKVVTIDGKTPDLLRSFVRWAGYFLSALPFLLGFLLALIDEEKQALHDKFAGTYVVDTAAWKEISGCPPENQ